MDFINLTDSAYVRAGLDHMVTAAIGQHDYVRVFVEVPIALLIVELAKRAEDDPEWFPHGKWATIQVIQAKIDRELDRAALATAPTGEKG